MVVGWKDADHGAYSAFWWCKDLVPLSDLTNLCISLISHSSKVNTWCRKDLFHFIHCFNVAVSRFHWPLALDHKTERDSACSLLYCKFLIYLLTPPFLPHFSFFPVAHKWKLAELVIAAVISSTWSTGVPTAGKKLPGCSSVGSVLSLNHINPLGKHCSLEHIISGDAYPKDKIQHQDAKGENELLDITEIKEKE